MENLILSILATLSIGFVITICALVLAFYCSFYVLFAIGLFKMAKKMGHDSPWLAWIPCANVYLLFVLPKKTFEPLIFKKEISSRVNAFWMYVGGTVGVSIIAGIFSALSDVPFIGIIFAFIAAILDLVAVFSAIVYQYPAYRDLLENFFGPEASLICSIVSIIFPMALPIIIFIAGAKPLRVQKKPQQAFLEKKDSGLGNEEEKSMASEETKEEKTEEKPEENSEASEETKEEKTEEKPEENSKASEETKEEKSVENESKEDYLDDWD